MGWFLYDNVLRHERVKQASKPNALFLTEVSNF